jgi:peptidoglycan hydrolase CwlO-like protein
MKPKRSLEDTAVAITTWVGSIQSVIVHSLFFFFSFLAVMLGLISFDRMLLVLTTLVSLEAIYLSIFIQMSLNFARQSLKEVEQDVDEIQHDVDEIQEDVGEIQQDVDEIQHDVDEIQEDIEDIEEGHTPAATH